MNLLHGPTDVEITGPDGGEAVERVNRSEGMAIRRSACDVKTEGTGRLKGLAVEVVCCGNEANAERIGHARDVGGHAGIAAPAEVMGDEHAGDLAEGSAAPFRLQIERQFVCRGGAIDAAAYLYLACVG